MIIRKIIFIAIALFLSSCGGGSGGNQGGTPINTQQATLDSNNTETIISEVVRALSLGITAEVGPNLNSPNFNASPLQLTQNGCLQGNISFSLTKDLNNAVTGNGAYNTYENCAQLTLSGDVAVTGALVGSRIGNFNYTFTNLLFTVTNTTITYRFSGSIDLTWKPSVGGSAGYIMVLNGTLYDSGQNTLFRVENFSIDANLAAGVQYILISGKLTHPVHGYVDISSINRIDFNIPGIEPQSGEFILTGNASKATVTYGSGGHSVVIE